MAMSSLIPGKEEWNLFDNSYEDFKTAIKEFFKDRFPAKKFAKNNFKLDVKEKDNTYIIEAELPGVNKDEVKVNFANGNLSITVTRESEKEEEQENYIHKERSFSSMSRSIYLENAKKEGITAKLQDGVLCITANKEILPPPAESEEIKVE
jgi:HSP20 family protein